MFHQHGQFLGKIRDRRDLLAYHFDFHDQMPQKLPLVGVIHRALERKLVNLADIVKKTTDQQEIHVDAAIVLGNLEDEL